MGGKKKGRKAKKNTAKSSAHNVWDKELQLLAACIQPKGEQPKPESWSVEKLVGEALRWERAANKVKAAQDKAVAQGRPHVFAGHEQQLARSEENQDSSEQKNQDFYSQDRSEQKTQAVSDPREADLRRRVKALPAFNAWFAQHCAEAKVDSGVGQSWRLGLRSTDGVQADDLEEGIGCVALRDLEQGQVFIRVPRRTFLSTETALRTPLATAFQRDSVCQSLPSLVLVIHLLCEDMNPQSHWRAYLDTLPRLVPLPLQYDLDLLVTMLSGWQRPGKSAKSGATNGVSDAPEAAPENCAYSDVESSSSVVCSWSVNSLPQFLRLRLGAMRQYFHTCSLLKPFVGHLDSGHSRAYVPSLPTFRHFLWALSVVMSRQNKVPHFSNPQAGEEIALVPAFDCINHRSVDGSGAVVTTVPTAYDTDVHCLQTTAADSVVKGHTVYMFYGNRNSTDMFCYAGFVDAEATNRDRVEVKIAMAPPAPRRRRTKGKQRAGDSSDSKAPSDEQSGSQEDAAHAAVLQAAVSADSRRSARFQPWNTARSALDPLWKIRTLVLSRRRLTPLMRVDVPFAVRADADSSDGQADVDASIWRDVMCFARVAVANKDDLNTLVKAGCQDMCSGRNELAAYGYAIQRMRAAEALHASTLEQDRKLLTALTAAPDDVQNGELGPVCSVELKRFRSQSADRQEQMRQCLLLRLCEKQCLREQVRRLEGALMEFKQAGDV